MPARRGSRVSALLSFTHPHEGSPGFPPTPTSDMRVRVARAHPLASAALRLGWEARKKRINQPSFRRRQELCASLRRVPFESPARHPSSPSPLFPGSSQRRLFYLSRFHKHSLSPAIFLFLHPARIRCNPGSFTFLRRLCIPRVSQPGGAGEWLGGAANGPSETRVCAWASAGEERKPTLPRPPSPISPLSLVLLTYLLQSPEPLGVSPGHGLLAVPLPIL